MTNREFIEMMVSERIHILLGRKLAPEEREILDRGERIIQGLNEEQQAGLEAYMDQMVSIEAAAERKAYLGGVKDGICLILGILRVWQGECGGDTEETEKTGKTGNQGSPDQKGGKRCTGN